MSHDQKQIICPNCGYHAVENYCARCGQETHPHKETFWGLAMHFIGHYFHYDSKFWQTMKALWFSPGKLTTAYCNNQRMRYISPVSLYIFISAVYFLTSSALSHKSEGPKITKGNMDGIQNTRSSDSVSDSNRSEFTYSIDTSISPFIRKQIHKIESQYGSMGKYMGEKIFHNIPKVFFLMIPFMALFLKLLFARRKETLFFHHAIFSLHYHSLWFSVFFITEIIPFETINKLLYLCLLVVVYIYLVKALRNVYHISRGRAVAYTWIIGALYGFIFSMTFLAYTMVNIALA